MSTKGGHPSPDEVVALPKVPSGPASSTGPQVPEPPTIEDIERTITALGYGTQEYHEAMALYLLTMARAQWRLADLAHTRNRRKARA